MPRPLSVLVAGDIVIDRHIYEGDRFTLRDEPARGTRTVEETGGAALTQRLISAVFDADVAERLVVWNAKPQPRPQKPEPSVCRLGCQLAQGAPGSPPPEWLVGTASWRAFSKPDSRDLFWRVSKAFGYGLRPADDATVSAGMSTEKRAESTADAIAKMEAASALHVPQGLPLSPDVLVLDDGGDRFRHKAHAHVWHLPADHAALPTWIILKLAGAIGRGDLWDHLMQCDPSERLIVVVSARLLRQDDVRLSRGLSWERTVEHLVHELAHNPAIQPLRQARHLIVTFEGDGAVWIDFSKPLQATHLVFDAAHAEGEWAGRLEGDAFGFQTCVVAAAVNTLASLETVGAEPDFRSGIASGLSAMRNLRVNGHGVACTDKDEYTPGSGFPHPRLAKEILHPSHRFERAIVPARPTNLSSWSILASLQNPSAPTHALFGFARQLAIQGDTVLDYVPHLRIGKLLAVGRSEMETLRSLRRIMVAYRDQNVGKKPLCIGVFGKPGSGKSFGVEQLAVGVFGQRGEAAYDGWMEFNLSQFDTPADLIGAFHQVRDRVLQKFVPVVFWDEFDARDYKWLQFLLAPMQDGRFQEDQITHTLGKCVFVFAGGTADTYDSFGPKEKDKAFPQFRLAKGPDFKSRLDGYLNVVGPNADGGDDVFYPVRRALMMRNLLGCRSGDRLDIDGGLLTALLEVTEYKHGARSLGKVLEPFCAARKNSRAPLRRSQLPAPNQLSLHVESAQLHDLCARDLPFKADDVMQSLPPAIHETWRIVAQAQGWPPKYDMPFGQLPPDIKRSNEAAARRIPDILALVGLKIVRGAATKKEEQAVRHQLELHLDSLAEEEHKGWMLNAELDGWRFAEVRDDDKRAHDCLRPYQALRDSEKDKDRSSVKHIPDFVRLAGYKIVFIGDEGRTMRSAR